MEKTPYPENLVLYVRTGCPHCARVLHAGEELTISFHLKNIADWDTQEELEAVGGKVLVPYLIDGNTGVSMYEADDIVTYLHQTYGKGAVQQDDTNATSNSTCTV